MAEKVNKIKDAKRKKLSDQLLARVKVKVTKVELDDRMSLCGEPLQKDKDTGEHFFIIPGHQADYVNVIFPSYEVSDEFETGSDKDITPKDSEPVPHALPAAIQVQKSKTLVAEAASKKAKEELADSVKENTDLKTEMTKLQEQVAELMKTAGTKK